MWFATFQLMLGKIGRFLSQFYGEYARYINFVVLLYGISLLWAHNNLRVAIRSMEKGMVHFAEEAGQKFNVREIYKNSPRNGWNIIRIKIFLFLQKLISGSKRSTVQICSKIKN